MKLANNQKSLTISEKKKFIIVQKQLPGDVLEKNCS